MGKTILYCGSGSERDYNGKVERGIQHECRENGISFIGLCSLYNYDTHVAGSRVASRLERGEYSVFELADFDDIDGAIILDQHFINHEKVDELVSGFKEAHIPTVILDGIHEGCYNVLYNDTSGMGEIVEHLISKHNCRKISFIAGFSDSRESDDRLKSYRRILERHNIPYDENRVEYGDYGANTIEALEKLLEYEEGLPDAIVCCNDLMAMHVIGYLGEHGIKVPEEVIVTGYDGIKEGELYYPALTSVKRGLFESGRTAVKNLIKIWNDEAVAFVTQVPPLIVYSQSCGCKPKDRVNISRFSKYHYELSDLYKKFNYDLVNLTNDMTSAVTIDDIFASIFANDFVEDMSKMIFCINDGILASGNIMNEREPEMELFTEIMTAYFLDESGKVTCERFPTWQMLPECCKSDTTDEFTYFYPMYFNKKILGYVALKVTDYQENILAINSMLRTISNSIGDFCIRSDKEAVVKQLEYMYVRDPLTMLYNRRGLSRECEKMLDAADNGKYIMGIGIDLDDLKMINDNYGHDEGDNAIVQCANAIKFANAGGEICSRIGGDEFFVTGVSESREAAEVFVDKIGEFLDKYNRSSGKGYRVECSCGMYVAPASKVKTLESIIKFADRDMYRTKQQKKSGINN